MREVVKGNLETDSSKLRGILPDFLYKGRMAGTTSPSDLPAAAIEFFDRMWGVIGPVRRLSGAAPEDHQRERT